MRAKHWLIRQLRDFAAFGEGKGDLTASLQVYSFDRCGRTDLEHGDKIVLPSVRANVQQRFLRFSIGARCSPIRPFVAAVF
jgi:hypothetical protein